MAKGPTKAQQALAEAREWIEASKEEIKECETALAEARNQLTMHETIYAVLERALTRQSSQKSTTKRASKKASSSKSSTKTARASGMAAAIKGSIEAGRHAVKESDDDERCIRELENKDGSLTICGLLADDNIHHLRTHSHYHEFTTGKSAAPPAGGRSSANGGAGATTANLGTGTEDVSNAVHAGG